MTELTQENILLLDKLYNLRGEDSVVINDIRKSIDELEKSKDDFSIQKEEEENVKAKLEADLENFNSQTSMFLDNFSAFDNDSFNALRAIDVNLDLGSLREKVEKEMPVRQEELSSSINESKSRIDDSANNISRLKKELKEENAKLDEAEKNKGRLNDLLTDILLNKNDSYTRGYIRNILKDLSIFSDEEISTLELLILFPEKGLVEYEEKYKDGNRVEIQDDNNVFINENPSDNVEVDNNVENDESTVNLEQSHDDREKVNVIEESPIIEEEPITNNIFSIDDFLIDNELNKDQENEPNENVDDNEVQHDNETERSSMIFDNQDSNYSVTNDLEDKIINKDNNDFNESSDNQLIEFLKDLNIDCSNLEQSTMLLLSDVDKDVIKRNIEVLRGLDADDLLLKNDNGYMFIADVELAQKINFIRSKGINDKTIKQELENGNFREDYSSLEKKIVALNDNQININEENVSMLKDNIVRYYDNLSILRKNGIELDDKEIRNFKELLQTSPYILDDSEILKQNMIKIVRRNGKYALDVFWLEPQELTNAIEKIKSNNLSKLIEIAPEVLTKNIDTILKVVKYCESNNIPVFDQDTNSYYKYIYDYEEFVNMFKNADLDSIIIG